MKSHVAGVLMIASGVLQGAVIMWLFARAGSVEGVVLLPMRLVFPAVIAWLGVEAARSRYLTAGMWVCGFYCVGCLFLAVYSWADRYVFWLVLLFTAQAALLGAAGVLLFAHRRRRRVGRRYRRAAGAR